MASGHWLLRHLVFLAFLLTAGRLCAAPARGLALDSASPNPAWQRFLRTAPGEWLGEADASTGALRWARGSGIHWMPGRGNELHGPALPDPLPFLALRAEDFARDHRDLLGLVGFELRFDRERSASFGAPPAVQILVFRLYALGIPVQDARATFVVNNGNLVTFAVEAPPTAPKRLTLLLDRERALSIAATELERRSEIGVPEFRETTLTWTFSNGEWIPAWEGLVRDRSTGILHRVTTSAKDGSVLEARSLKADSQVTGGVRLRLHNDPQTLMPLRGVTVTDQRAGGGTAVTDAAGRFSLTGASFSATLTGPYGIVKDGCGSDAIIGDAAGLVFGATTRTDCVSQFPASPGDNSASRTASWHVNRIRDNYRGYDTSSAWLNSSIGIISNLKVECANSFDGDNIVLNWNGGSPICSNAGDGPEEVDHEWAHAYQWKTRGFFADAATREAYANVTSLLQFHNHCVGQGFWIIGTSENNSPCSGFQETDFSVYTPPVPALPQNIGGPPYSCPPDTTLGGGGIVGYEGHCEGHIMTQAMFELGTALVQKYGLTTGWDKLLRLWIAAGPLQNHAWNLTNPGPPVVADGCPAWTWFETLRAVDDDNGNLADGVPDGAEIFAAFNNHGIACPSDPNVAANTATCPVIPASVVTLSYSPLDDSETVSWTPVAGASGYRVLRSELGPEGAFTPIATTGAATTSFVDADGTRIALHWYAVVALGTGNCESPLSDVVWSTNCVPAIALAEPFDFAVIDPASATLSWTLALNATRYDLLLGTSSNPGPYAQTVSTSFPVPAGALAPGGTYWWKVAGSNAAAACAPAETPVRSFVVAGAPTAPSPVTVLPAAGPIAGGTSVTIAGTKLFIGAAVTIGGVPATVTSWGDGSTLTVTTPPNGPGPADVVVTNPGGVSSTLAGAFQYFCPSLALTAGNGGAVCAGGTISLTASTVAGATYSWSGPNGFISTQQNPTIANATTAMSGAYSATATVNGCSSPAATTTVTVNAIPATPTITIVSGTNPGVPGSSISLDAGAGYDSYLWSTGATTRTITVAPTIKTTYTVTGTTIGCTSAAGSFTRTIPSKGGHRTNPGISCKTIHLANPGFPDGLYWIDPNGPPVIDDFIAYCDMTTDGGGWTLAVNSVTGSEPPTADAVAVNGTAGLETGHTINATELALNQVAEIRHWIVAQSGNVFHAKYKGQYHDPLASWANWTVLPPHVVGSESLLTNDYASAWATAGACETTFGTPWYYGSPACVSSIPLDATNGASQGPVNTSGEILTRYSIFVRELCPPLSNVSIGATGSTALCAGTAGGTAAVTDTAGGTSTHQWGYRTASGGSITAIAGQTGTSYLITAADFGGAGAFLLVCTTTPTCGVTTVSNELPVTVNAVPIAPVVTNNGPICEGGTLQLSAGFVPGATYLWTGPNGFSSALQLPAISPVTPAAAGVYSATVTANGCTSPAASTTVIVSPVPAVPAITAPAAVGPGSVAHLASVVSNPGSTYNWGITNGTITAGAGTNLITFSAGVTGPVTLTVVETNSASCPSAQATATILVSRTAPAMFFTMSPCRLFDTRNDAGPDAAAPAMAATEIRAVAIGGRCGVPAAARSLSVNVTITGPTAPGHLLLYAADMGTPPLTSNINFLQGQTRGNNAIVQLAGDGSGIKVVNGSTGSVDFILDVNGYFQ